MSVTMDLGKVGVLYKGTHDSTQTYERNDIVMSNGSGYIAKQDVPAGIDISNSTYWGTIVVGADSNVFATKAYTASTYATIADVNALQAAVGSPLVASLIAEMTDTDKIYVYVGSETGYTSGNWYYYNGTTWVSGGTYNSQGIGDNSITDAKLVQSGGVISTVKSIEKIAVKNLLEGVAWEVGSINTTTGGNVDGVSNRIRTKEYIDLSTASQFTLTINNGYKYVIDYYDDDNNLVKTISGWGEWKTGSDKYTAWDGATKIRLLIADASDSAVSIDIVQQLSGVYQTKYYDAVTRLTKATELNSDNCDYGFELGTLNPGVGAENTSNTRIRSDFIRLGIGSVIVSNYSYNKNLIVYEYSKYKEYISDSSWSDGNIYVVNHDGYVRILLRKDNAGGVITEQEMNDMANSLVIYRAIPQELIEDTSNLLNENSIPSYYETQMQTAIESVRNNIFDVGIDGDTFAFITDLHWQSNAKHSPLLVKSVLSKANINRIICGGDLIGGGAKSAMIDLMSDCVDSFKDIAPFYTFLGNHDKNTIGASSTADNFTSAEAYALMQKQSDMYVEYGSPCYFYFDNKTAKTRYICLDTGLEGTALDTVQSNWLSATLTSMPSGYHALIFAHIIYQTTTTWHIGLTKSELARTSFMNAVCDILDSFNANNSDKKVEAIFGGHVHIDCDFATTGGIPIVLTDCDTRQTFTETSPGSGDANHALGTINEQCFDVITIDYTSSIIKCVRIGRGSDRTISY